MQIEKQVIEALKLANMPTDITMVLADRDGVEPEAPYLLIQIISAYNVNLPVKSTSHRDGNQVEIILQVKDYKVSLTFHAKPNDGTHDWVDYFYSGATADTYDWAFAQQGLGLISSDPIMYFSMPVDGENYKRAVMGLEFRTEVMNEYVVNRLDRVEYIGKLIDNTIGEFGEVIVDIDSTK